MCRQLMAGGMRLNPRSYLVSRMESHLEGNQQHRKCSLSGRVRPACHHRWPALILALPRSGHPQKNILRYYLSQLEIGGFYDVRFAKGAQGVDELHFGDEGGIFFGEDRLYLGIYGIIAV